MNFVKMRILHSKIDKSPYEEFWGKRPKIDWMRTYGSTCWAMIPKTLRKKGDYKATEGIFVGYFDDSKAYKIWIPRTRSIIKSRDVIFDEMVHIQRVTLHDIKEQEKSPWSNDDDLPIISNIQ
jgi:hypothetical protein